MTGPLSEFGEYRIEEIAKREYADGVVVSERWYHFFALVQLAGFILFYGGLLYVILLTVGLALGWEVELLHGVRAVLNLVVGYPLLVVARRKQREWGLAP